MCESSLVIHSITTNGRIPRIGARAAQILCAAERFAEIVHRTLDNILSLHPDDRQTIEVRKVLQLSSGMARRRVDAEVQKALNLASYMISETSARVSVTADQRYNFLETAKYIKAREQALSATLASGNGPRIPLMASTAM